MERSILIVNATQVITSENNPHGLFSVVNGFPKVFDSGVTLDLEQNMRNAKAAYHAQLSANYSNTNPNRVMMTVTLEASDGTMMLHEKIGELPNIVPDVEPEEAPEIEPEG